MHVNVRSERVNYTGPARSVVVLAVMRVVRVACYTARMTLSDVRVCAWIGGAL
jgi:hypothetical protein